MTWHLVGLQIYDVPMSLHVALDPLAASQSPGYKTVTVIHTAHSQKSHSYFRL